MKNIIRTIGLSFFLAVGLLFFGKTEFVAAVESVGDQVRTREKPVCRDQVGQPPKNGSSPSFACQEGFPGDRLTFVHRSVEYAFRWCPPGSFMMGSPLDEKGRYENEVRHKTILTKGFWILETEVTQEMYQSITGKNPSEFKGAKKPVDTVNWSDSMEFCRLLNERLFADSNERAIITSTGSNGAVSVLKDRSNTDQTPMVKRTLTVNNLSAFRVKLPTEAQWEYACRAGTSDPFAGPLEKIAWFGEPNESGSTHVSGTKSPNNWGIYDMHGNLWEWCADWYHDVSAEPVVDPEGPADPDNGVRIDRGGCWDSSPDYCRCAHRGCYEPDRASRYVGFRVVLAF